LKSKAFRDFANAVCKTGFFGKKAEVLIISKRKTIGIYRKNPPKGRQLSFAGKKKKLAGSLA